MATPLGKKIRQLRNHKKLSLEGLAKVAGISKSYLSELESDDAANPTMTIISKIARELDTTAEALTYDDKVDQPEDAFDRAFLRNYKALQPQTKQQLLEMLKILKKGERT
jgi:transcriptional regulator with XRE-family HTH domain